MDKKDAAIIRHLEIDGRASFAQIGRKVRLSKEVVNYRIQRMIEQGIIKRFEATINQFSMGYQQYRVLATIDPQAIPQLRKKFGILARQRKLSKWNVDIAIWAKTNAEFEKQLTQLQLANVRIFLVTKRYSLLHAYLHGEQQHQELIAGSHEIDAKSQRILEELQNDGRMSAVDLAKKVGISSVAIAERIRDLQKKHILLGTRIVLDTSLLGYDSYQIHVKTTTLTPVREWLLLEKQVTGIRQLIGDFDLEFSIQVPNAQNLAEFMENLASKGVEDFDIALIAISRSLQ
jgi:Lrp/AsnC family transcriptional regulator, leucine-responsive regulatory protein